MDQRDRINLRRYFLFTYLFFWVFIGIIGFLLSRDLSPNIMTILQNLSAWSPTIVFFIMFRKIHPHKSLKNYLKNSFSQKIKMRELLSPLILQLLVLAFAVIAYYTLFKKPLHTMTFLPASSLLSILFLNLTSGAMGEELGWRRYALNMLKTKYSQVTSGIIVGIVWGLWHLPLMLFSGYSGGDLIIYMITFMVAIISFSIVMTFFYERTKNLLIAMWMHFWFNFLLKLVLIDILPLLTFISLGYIILAIGLIVLQKRKFKVLSQ